MTIDWQPVQSSAVEAVAYDEDEETMFVRYKTGDEYQFDGVSYADYEGVRGSSSIGRALQVLGTRGRRI